MLRTVFRVVYQMKDTPREQRRVMREFLSRNEFTLIKETFMVNSTDTVYRLINWLCLLLPFLGMQAYAL